ncbi:MAG TPA: sigma-70 family RNA polymerase sigma factor [Chloroflexia bacterium]|nr:sigma-70 family RNA polymerase sigma factor [Chloroflexia bacterium]
MVNIATATKGWFGGNVGRGQSLAKQPVSKAAARPVAASQAQASLESKNGLIGKSVMTEPGQEMPTGMAGGDFELSAGDMTQDYSLGSQSYGPSSAEVQLIRRAQTGDQFAFAELVELHQDFVYNLAFRILQNAEEADDATQEAFVKIWQALPGFRGDSKFTTWAYRIVRNSCLNRLRSVKNNPRLVTVETNFEDGEDEGREIVVNLPGSQTDEPAWHFDSQERSSLIWEEVDRLPHKYREIIALYYSEELSYEEIAASLEVPVGTVKTHLFRAKALLKGRLQELNQNGMLDFS